MPNTGSVNQTEPSDFTTTSLGELRRLPSKLSASTVMEPSYSVRIDAAPAVQAGDEAALAVAGVAVGEVRRLAEDADRARLLLPLEDAVVGDVAPEQVAPVAEVDRALGPAAAGGEPLHAGELEPVLLEARIERDNGWVGIARGLLPAGGEGGDGRGGGHGACSGAMNSNVIAGLVLGIQSSPACRAKDAARNPCGHAGCERCRSQL